MRFTSVLVLVCLLMVGSSNAAARDSTSPKPEWQINVSIPHYPHEAGLRPLVRPAVTFIDSGKLAVAYADAAPKGSPSAWELNLLVLNVRDGIVQARKTFPIAAGNAGLFRSTGGKLAVSLGDRLILLSPQTLLTERSRDIEGAIQPYSDGERVVVLKSNTVTVMTGPQSGDTRGSGYKVSFVRLDTLETQATCDRAALDIPEAIQGDRVARSMTNGDPHPAIYLGSFCGDWMRIVDLQERPNFLGSEKLVATDPPDTEHPRLTVVTTTGKEVCRIELQKHSGSLEPAKPSLDGRRFAVRIHDTSGLEIRSLDIWRHTSKVHIAVYGFTKDNCGPSLLDVETRVSPRPPSDFAVSHDGERLVTIGDGRVSMFRVP